MNNGLCSLSLLVLLIVGTQVAAQETAPLITKDSESTLIKRKSIVIVRKRSEKVETKGLKLGNFDFLPAVALTEYYDDNVFATDGDEKNDLITVVTPTFELKSDWQQHEFNLDAGVEAVRHVDLAAENTDNAWLNLNGQYDFSKRSHLLAGVSYMRDHEDRGSADSEAGENPTEFDDRSVDIGYSGSKGNHFFKFNLNTRRLDFHDVDSPSRTIDYDDRDRDEDVAGLRYLFRYAPKIAFYFDAVADRRDYRQTPDNEGNDRSSEGSRYAVGIEGVGTNKVGRVFVGRLNRDYQSPDFDKAEESDFGLQLRWKIYPTTNLLLRSRRSIEETTLDSSPGYLLQNNLLRLSIALSKERSLTFDLIAAEADYAAIERQDDYLNYGVAYSQQLLPNLEFGIDAHRAERDSSTTGEDYRINQVFFRVKAVL
ncbi:MAG: outer membrane beta-barrel protein [Gammaproteobacteria bacterium]|nr:outer membrane beta-barrel protein [Gammaproteobacteria bacterium]